MSEIKMPMDVTNAVIDAVGWMVTEGQSFGDDIIGGIKLSQWLLDNYADHPDIECWLGEKLRDFIERHKTTPPRN